VLAVSSRLSVYRDLAPRSHCPGGLRSDIGRLGFTQNLIAEIVAQRCGRVQVDLVAQETAKLVLQTEEVEAGNMPRFKLHEHVDVTVFAKISTQDRAEERKLPDVVPAIGSLECRCPRWRGPNTRNWPRRRGCW
jgi:hypothetical protein